MLTNEEFQVVHAHVLRHFWRDVLRVIGLNIFPVAFVGITKIATVWFYLGWFTVCAIVVAIFGCSVSRVSISELELTDRIPRDIFTIKRGALLVGIQACIIAIARACLL